MRGLHGPQEGYLYDLEALWNLGMIVPVFVQGTSENSDRYTEPDFHYSRTSQTSLSLSLAIFFVYGKFFLFAHEH